MALNILFILYIPPEHQALLIIWLALTQGSFGRVSCPSLPLACQACPGTHRLSHSVLSIPQICKSHVNSHELLLLGEMYIYMLILPTFESVCAYIVSFEPHSHSVIFRDFCFAEKGQTLWNRIPP
jgi:hypothetical protein